MFQDHLIIESRNRIVEVGVQVHRDPKGPGGIDEDDTLDIVKFRDVPDEILNTIFAFDAITESYSEHPGQVKHSASIGHELLAGAAAYEAADLYEKHVQKNGKPTSHAEAKKIAAGFAGVFITHIATTKGEDALSKYEEKKAREKAEQELGAALEAEYN